MAERGEDFAYDNPAFEPEEGTSFTNTGFEDEGEDTQYNVNQPGNLDTSTSFLEPEPERAPTIDPELMAQDLDYTHTQDLLKKALTGTSWKFTETGLAKLTPKIRKEGNQLFYITDFSEIDLLKNQSDRNIRLTKANGKFYAYNSLTKYGTRFVDHLKDLLNTPDENIPMTKMTNMDNQPSKVEHHSVENMINQPNSIDAIIDTDETTLKDLGFSKNALRELRALKQSGDDLAAVKREKDMQIEELEKKLNNLQRDYINSVEEDV
ncbi:MAG: hypothetical protein MJA29_08110, partial [Candidatus Omnitrophica bacterium]|nr:hypothetical protein [Candidatus Omnitrophota bacterium]